MADVIDLTDKDGKKLKDPAGDTPEKRMAYAMAQLDKTVDMLCQMETKDHDLLKHCKIKQFNRTFSSKDAARSMAYKLIRLSWVSFDMLS